VKRGRLETGLTLGLALIGIAWAGFLADIHVNGRGSGLDPAEDVSLDFRFAIVGPRPAPENVVIVAIDDATIGAYRQYPLSRRDLAQLVDALKRAEVKAIAFDLLLTDPEASEADNALADTLRGAPAVIAAAATFSRQQPSEPAEPGTLGDIPSADGVLFPLDLFRAAAEIGVANVSSAASGTPRHLPLLVRWNDQILPGLPMRAAALAAGTGIEIDGDRVQLGEATVNADLGLSLPLRFYGPRGTFRTISFLDALKPENAAALAGKIAIVGVTGLGTGDTFATPYDPVLPGVEVLATGLAHLTNGDGLVRTPAIRLFDAIGAMLLTLLVVPLVMWRRTWVGLGLAAFVMAASALLAIVAFANGIWLSMALPLAALLPPAILAFAARLLVIQLTERRLRAERQTLRRFQPAALADRLSQSADYLSEPVQQMLAILFIDLSGFTGTSERIGLDRTRSLLKGLHDVIDAVVSQANGVVLSYMGDGAMIVFGLPEPRPEDAARAVEAALALNQAVTEWLATLEREIAPTGVRVGAHFGAAVVSRLGGDQHQHITATGDSVNVTSRLLQVATDFNAAIVFSAAILDAAGSDLTGTSAGNLSSAREVHLRGRAGGLVVRLWNPMRS
jgi:adenylate cyclase